MLFSIIDLIVRSGSMSLAELEARAPDSRDGVASELAQLYAKNYVDLTSGDPNLVPPRDGSSGSILKVLSDPSAPKNIFVSATAAGFRSLT